MFIDYILLQFRHEHYTLTVDEEGKGTGFQGPELWQVMDGTPTTSSTLKKVTHKERTHRRQKGHKIGDPRSPVLLEDGRESGKDR